VPRPGTGPIRRATPTREPILPGRLQQLGNGSAASFSFDALGAAARTRLLQGPRCTTERCLLGPALGLRTKIYIELDKPRHLLARDILRGPSLWKRERLVLTA
jgi:hypothetical protein